MNEKIWKPKFNVGDCIKYAKNKPVCIKQIIIDIDYDKGTYVFDNGFSNYGPDIDYGNETYKTSPATLIDKNEINNIVYDFAGKHKTRRKMNKNKSKKIKKISKK